MDAYAVPPVTPGPVVGRAEAAATDPPCGPVEKVRHARGRRGGPRAGRESLTPTERSVAAHVACGRSNAEVGAVMQMSPGTVRSHLRSVFAKLGVTSRTELADRA